MITKPILTPLITTGTKLISIIDISVNTMEENQVLAVSSKIISLCEGSVCDSSEDKDIIIKHQAQMYLDRVDSAYNAMHTITKGTLMLAAGIDESNADGHYVLWPKNPLQTAQAIYNFLTNKFSIKNIGIIIVDSTSKPLRIGTIGTSIAHYGFNELYDYRGTKDLFGRTIEVSQQNIAEGLASVAVLTMGEGTEQTPLAIIQDIPNIQFDSTAGGTSYATNAQQAINNDVYEPLLKSVKWRKGNDYTSNY
jgi:F420-0:gamma-glutamyl ligase